MKEKKVYIWDDLLKKAVPVMMNGVDRGWAKCPFCKEAMPSITPFLDLTVNLSGQYSGYHCFNCGRIGRISFEGENSNS